MFVNLDDFKNETVVVPKFKDSDYGIIKVDRGDMSDHEWRTWRKVSESRAVAKIMVAHRKSGEPIGKMSQKIIDYLTEQGIAACLTGNDRPITTA